MAEKKTEVSSGTDRRHFLKGSALAAMAAMVEAKPALSAAVHAANLDAQAGASAMAERSVDLANALQGTDSTVFAWEHTADRGGAVWDGALDVAVRGAEPLDVPAVGATAAGISQHASAEPLAFRLRRRFVAAVLR